MDTRTKILALDQAREILRRNGRRTAVLTGYFDPLLAAHAERLEQVRRAYDALLVVVTAPPSPILPGPARAALVAGLDAVDYVVALADGEPLDAELAATAIREEDADQRRFETLVERVQGRQRAGLRT